MSAIIGSLGGFGLLFNNYTASSLNLFFFWVTWTTLILSHPPLRIELVATFAIRVLFFLLPALVFTLFDSLLPSLAGKALRTVSKPAPQKASFALTGKKKSKDVQAPSSNVNRGVFFAILMTLGNLLLGIAMQAVLEFIAVDILKRKRLLRVASTLPYPWDMAKGIGYAIILREILIFYPHRHIHNTPHSPLHKQHIHATPTRSSLNLTSTTPIDYLLLQFFPVYLPSIMLSFHLLTYLAFVAITSLVDLICYSQYDYLPKAFFIGRIAKRVGAHYDTGGSCGYGWIGILDWLHGTEAKWNKGGVAGVGEGGEDGEGFTEAVRKGVKAQKATKDRKKSSGSRSGRR